jgi:hypothetical protein
MVEPLPTLPNSSNKREKILKLLSEGNHSTKDIARIAEYGFHPELVENEYQMFQRLVECDIDSLQKKFFVYFKRDLVTANDNTLNLLQEKYRNDGKLSPDEFINLRKSLVDEKYRRGEASAIHDLLNGTVPDGWEAVLCLNCNKPIRGSIKHPAKTITITLSYKLVPLTHPSLGMSCV